VTPASRTPDEITAEIAETRERLATTIDTLVYRAAPKTILSRRMETIKAKFVTTDGSPDLQMIGKVAGGVLGFVVLVVAIRKVAG
jgi:predicted transcriptional regulator